MNYDPTDYGYCPYCMSSTHKASCPNANQVQEQKGICDICGEPIYSGDMIFRTKEGQYHQECFEEIYLTKA